MPTSIDRLAVVVAILRKAGLEAIATVGDPGAVILGGTPSKSDARALFLKDTFLVVEKDGKIKINLPFAIDTLQAKAASFEEAATLVVRYYSMWRPWAAKHTRVRPPRPEQPRKRMCTARRRFDGAGCIKPPGHEGDHQSVGIGGGRVTWPQALAREPTRRKASRK